MNAVVDETLEGIRLDLQIARLGLIDARRAQGLRDSATTRLAVQACLDRLDVVLDVWLIAADGRHV
jgi:hypothetical protein